MLGFYAVLQIHHQTEIGLDIENGNGVSNTPLLFFFCSGDRVTFKKRQKMFTVKTCSQRSGRYVFFSVREKITKSTTVVFYQNVGFGLEQAAEFFKRFCFLRRSSNGIAQLIFLRLKFGFHGSETLCNKFSVQLVQIDLPALFSVILLLSEDSRGFVLDSESSYVVKLIFQMYLEDMKIQEIARALDVQGVPSPQVQMAQKKRLGVKTEWPVSTIRAILQNPLYIGKCTLKLAKAKREIEVPPIVSESEFQEVQEKIKRTKIPSRKRPRKKPNLLFKKIYDKKSGKRLLCRTSEDESQQVYSFDKGYRCFSGKAPFIESEKIFREILSALEKEKMQAAHIDRVLDLNPEKVKQCMDAGLLQYRKKANEIVARLMAKDDERTAVYREYEQGSISLEQVEEYEYQYQVAVQKQEAAFKKVMLAVNDIEKAFSHGNPWLMKFRAISIPNKLDRVHIKKWIDSVWVEEFEQVEVILKESQWKRFFPEEWLNNGEENYNGKKK